MIESMKPVILVYKKEMSRDLIKKLEQNYDVRLFDRLTLKSPQILEALKDSIGILGWGGHIGKDLLDCAPHLRVVSTISVGFDHCDVQAMTERGVALMHTPKILTDAVADIAMGLILATARRIVQLDKLVRGGWTSQVQPDLYGVDVFGKTLGIVGMGRIGLAIAERAHHGFRMPILYHSRNQHSDVEERTNGKFLPVETLLTESDFVCNVLPATPETRHFFNHDRFKIMRKNSIFINVGRGSTVDEHALLEALEAKRVLAAGLDVFEKEPLVQDSPFISRDDVVLLPHIGSATHETRREMDVLAVNNLIAALRGDLSQNCVNKQQLMKLSV